MLQCVAVFVVVCCSALQRVAVCVAMYCRKLSCVLQCVAVSCSVCCVVVCVAVCVVHRKEFTSQTTNESCHTKGSYDVKQCIHICVYKYKCIRICVYIFI